MPWPSALMKYETIDETQLKDIMAGREPQPPEGWDSQGPAPTAPATATPTEERRSRHRGARQAALTRALELRLFLRSQ